MKLYLKLLMFTLMISDARIIVNEIMREMSPLSDFVTSR